MSQPRHIEQAFWLHPQLPHIELRSTQHSDRAYKLHSHPSLSIVAIVSGNTLVTYQNKEYTPQPGQLIFIGPDELHLHEPERRVAFLQPFQVFVRVFLAQRQVGFVP